MASYYDACVIVAGDAGIGGTRKAAVDTVTGVATRGSDFDEDAVRTKNWGEESDWWATAAAPGDVAGIHESVHDGELGQ